MLFIESHAFTRRVTSLLDDEEYLQLQRWLVALPIAGAVIPGGGGVRKLRWLAKGAGKRGGVRVIYYYAAQRDIILLLAMYEKNQQSDLSKQELERLRRAVEAEYEK